MLNYKFNIPFFLLVITIFTSCDSSSSQNENKEVVLGTGPCFEMSLGAHLKDEFKVAPNFSSKGEKALKQIEEETGMNRTYWIGHFDVDSLDLTCRTLDLVFETTDLNKYISLDTSGRMNLVMKQMFDIYLTECKNTNAYKDVILRFIVGKDESYEDFISEKFYNLSAYRDSLYINY